MTHSEDSVERGEQYLHNDGSREVVFHVEDGRVLTVKEYPTLSSYRTAVADADPHGKHEGVLELPDVSAFEDIDL